MTVLLALLYSVLSLNEAPPSLISGFNLSLTDVLFGVGLPLQSPILQIDREYRKDDSSVHGLSETIVGWNRVEPDPRM